eukprot:CAMPEP_0197623930 /NCGR_PEP_ID=MMETSP1338-20131121/3797_1 /TAXON_ID=43686 ORGANISM="Pelagodinium beii, Strain RCC1491" /NCGR_SAMPLE_ID=MMETSP1338 /ASSEMBLY_ACC=CAM_ASM_000754 /LENGTH=851 /DNA_ID=CAMNT_0043194023 /DNA_START=55 /DNA_END=2610 /DNA_ORIENTATION=+
MAPFQGKAKGKGSHGKGSSGRQGSHPWINQQLIRASESNFDMLMSTVMLYVDDMNIVNLSTATHRIAKQVSCDRRAFQAMQQQHQQKVDKLLVLLHDALDDSRGNSVQPQTLSNVLWSLAHMQKFHKPLIQRIALHTMSALPQFKSYELASLLWAVAKLGSAFGPSTTDAALFAAAAGCITEKMQDYDFRSFSTVLWAFATAKQRNAKLFRGIAGTLLTMTGASCQEMANTVWAFATNDFRDSQLFHELAQQGCLKMDQFKAQELSNMLWGFATHGFYHEAFYAKAADAITYLAVNPQNLANILWAFARVRPRDELTRRTVMSLVPLCIMQLASFKAQEMSSTLLALSKTVSEAVNCEQLPDVQRIVEDFFKACLPIIVGRSQDFSCHSLGNCINSYARVPVQGYKMVMKACSTEIHHKIPCMDLKTMVHVLDSLCRTPELTPDALTALCDEIVANLGHAGPSEWQILVRLLRAPAKISTAEMQRDLLHLPRRLLEEQRVANVASQTAPFFAEDASKVQLCTPLQYAVQMPTPLPVGPIVLVYPASTPDNGQLEQGAQPETEQSQDELVKGSSQLMNGRHEPWSTNNSFLHTDDSDSDVVDDGSTECSRSFRSRSQLSSIGRSSFASLEMHAFGGRVLPSPEHLQALVPANLSTEEMQTDPHHFPPMLLEEQHAETEPSNWASPTAPCFAGDAAIVQPCTPLPEYAVQMPPQSTPLPSVPEDAVQMETPLPDGPLGIQKSMDQVYSGSNPGKRQLEQGVEPVKGSSQLMNGHERWIIKNSFLHIDDSDSDEEDDGSTDCSRSCRSRSQPSSIGRSSFASRERYAFGGRVLPSPEHLEHLQALAKLAGEAHK